MSNIISHFKTITKHRHMVIRHCFKAGILWRGLLHDLSKYTPTEFCAGARFYKGTRSPNEAERETFGYSKAWMHHKGRNRHHFEYWNDYNPKTRRIEPVPMPIRYVKEMFCDRVAASKIYQKENYTDQHPLQYFRNSHSVKTMHPDTAEILEKWLEILAREGEGEAFRAIRGYK